jgi:hypothetical protein|tara:strand:+ start:142 stop:444 length:303 start_codon:yes stop_codon:yes gene_type:complete
MDQVEVVEQAQLEQMEQILKAVTVVLDQVHLHYQVVLLQVEVVDQVITEELKVVVVLEVVAMVLQLEDLEEQEQLTLAVVVEEPRELLLALVALVDQGES